MFVGDFAQLPPVMGNLVYLNCDKESDLEKIGKQAFSSIETTFHLSQNFRQNTDVEFQELLEHCRYGKSYEEDYKLVKEQFHSGKKNDEKFKDSLKLFYYN